MFKLPDLPFSTDALEPFIDQTTMELHHGKHHAAYVTNLNAALEGIQDCEDKTIEEVLRNVQELPAQKRMAVINHGGGHVNHSMLWKILTPGGSNIPKGELDDSIRSEFETFDKMKEVFSERALKYFGSGWVWLVVTPECKLEILSTRNQDSPIMVGKIPVLGIDLWEHAYYLQYQNRRAEYIVAFFQVVNFREIERLYHNALAVCTARMKSGTDR